MLLRGRSNGGEWGEGKGAEGGDPGGGGDLRCSVVGDWGPWDGCLGGVYHKGIYMSVVKGYLNKFPVMNTVEPCYYEHC